MTPGILGEEAGTSWAEEAPGPRSSGPTRRPATRASTKAPRLARQAASPKDFAKAGQGRRWSPHQAAGSKVAKGRHGAVRPSWGPREPLEGRPRLGAETGGYDKAAWDRFQLKVMAGRNHRDQQRWNSPLPPRQRRRPPGHRQAEADARRRRHDATAQMALAARTTVQPN